jgi:hypothetical protein
VNWRLLIPAHRRGRWPSIPKTRAHFLSVVLLAVLLAAYSAKWITDLAQVLFDPDCQTDDVRGGLAGFHRFAPEPLLTNDPLTADLYLLYMPAIRLLYRIAVPFAGLPSSTKIVQAIALGLILLASVLIVRSRRGGFAAGALLLFFSLHAPYVMNRIAGGSGRAFIFPFFALWIAGAIAKNERLRAIVILIASITQANGALILLGAEGLLVSSELAPAIFRLRRKFRITHPAALRLARLFAVGIFCFLLTQIYSASTAPLGAFISYEEATKNPAFVKGNYWEDEIPFPDPVKEFKRWLSSPLSEEYRATTWISRGYAAAGQNLRWVILGVFLVLAAVFARPHQAIPIVLLLSSIVCYVVARMLAFRLYSPERYYSFGGTIATIALIVVAIGCTQLWRRARKRRDVVRNFAAASVIVLVWLTSGRTGVTSGATGCVITERPNLPLYNFVRGLPKETRILAHAHDSDDIPWWTGRATTGGFEMCTVWRVDAHKRCVDMMMGALLAYYSIDRRALFDYLEREKITHILVHKERVSRDFAVKSGVAEPMQGKLKKWLAGKNHGQFVLNDVSPGAIVFRHHNFELVDVERLRIGWGM